MIYLHEAPYGDKFVRHWANESESAEDTEATFKIRQVETDLVYGEAIDVVPCRYTYEATDEPIDDAGEATEQDYVDALHEFGAEATE